MNIIHSLAVLLVLQFPLACNEALEIQVAELEECKKQATELKEHNRFLENKMIEMCKVAEHEDENKRVRILSQQMEDILANTAATSATPATRPQSGALQ